MLKMIKEGDILPNNKIVLVNADGSNEIETDKLFSNKKVVFFALPGAFTPTCNNDHLPSYINKFAEFKNKGVDNIICLAVNDQFVIKAWQSFNKVWEKEFFFIADGNCKMTESLGMVLDCSGFGMGKRSQRYVMLVENKIIKKLIVEKDPGVCSLTNADSILNSI